MQKIAISIGDINGVGIQLALENHHIVKNLCKPLYCIDKKTLNKAVKLLDIQIPSDFHYVGKYSKCSIKPSLITKSSGRFSYESFQEAIKLANVKTVDGICTLPINKKAWQKANINYVGHTDMLRDRFNSAGIMMMGCSKMYVALFTEHIPLSQVPKQIHTGKLVSFFISLIGSLKHKNIKHIAVLGLNPHAGDGGVLGGEEVIIKKAIKLTNKFFERKILKGVFVPDVAFTKKMRKKFKYFVAMYHDQGLIPLKALYFDKSINITLNIPISRTSVDHGTAFDIAYKSNNNLSNKSYINAIKELCGL